MMKIQTADKASGFGVQKSNIKRTLLSGGVRFSIGILPINLCISKGFWSLKTKRRHKTIQTN
jgi:hypothetical protein